MWISVKLRLSISRDSWAAWRLLAAVAGSALLHGAALAAVVRYYPGGEADGEGSLFPKYHLQMLRLAPQPRLTMPPELVKAVLPPVNRRDVPAPPARTPARQTLIVEGAPPGWKLDQNIPLPAVRSWTLARPLPLHAEQVRIEGPEAEEQLPQTISPGAPDPPKVNMISLPDSSLEAPTASIPAVNQSTAGSSQAEDASSPPSAAGQAGQGGSGQAPATAEAVPGQTLTRIELPPDGRPQMSVLGESVAEQYSETMGQLRGRVVSTIYLRMGLKKNWLLEYWMPPQAAASPQKGALPSDRGAAPWPYLMFRPEVAFPPGADAVLVRGVLTTEGQLERLTLLLPPEWAQKDALFRALAQWKFRPASRNGQAQAVEVLLVIPRQPDE